MKNTARSQYRLRTLLTYPFVALILLPALLIAGTSLYTGLNAVDTLSERVIIDVSSRVEQASVHQLEEAAIALRSTLPSPQYVSAATVAMFADPTEVERTLFELGFGARTSSYFYYGTAAGAFIGVDRGRIGGQASALVRTKRTPGEKRHIYSASRPGDRSRLIEVEQRTFNVTERPWFTAAARARKLTWTPVYVSFASKALVTTASQPLYGTNGELVGVLAADVELAGLSAFMKGVSVSETGVAFIVDEQGFLVASTTPGEPFKSGGTEQQRIRATESLDPVERAAAIWLQRRQAGGESVSDRSMLAAKIKDAHGDAIDLAVRRVSGVEGVAWDVVVAIPRRDLTAPIVKSAVAMFLVTFGALVAALQLGLWIVRRVTRDVDSLVDAARRATVEGSEFVEPQTTLQETGILSSAFRGMFASLNRSAATIQSQNDALAALNATLEERVDRRIQQLEEKNFDLLRQIAAREALERELRDANEMVTAQSRNKARFISMLSHELRTPLQSIVAEAELLRTNHPDRAAINTETLSAASRSLLSLVDQILSQGFIDSGRIEIALGALNIRELIADAVRIACSAASVAESRVRIHVSEEVPGLLHGDGGVVRQVVLNLLANAFKHAPNANVEVRVRMAPLPQGITALASLESSAVDTLLIEVSDDGPGVPTELQPTLFDVTRAYSRREATGARGLGLVICGLLVKSLGGRIEYSPVAPRGSRFSFFAQVAHPTPEHRELASGAVDAKDLPTVTLKCLLVDDNPVNLQLIRQLLLALGHRVSCVTTGEAAVAEARNTALDTANNGSAAELFDVVLMDLNLPGMSGAQALHTIADECRQRSLPVPRFIVLTASTHAEFVAQVSAVDEAIYLSKPATIDSLRHALAARPISAASTAVVSPNAADRVIDQAILMQLAEIEKKSPDPFLNALLHEFVSTLPDELGRCVAAAYAGNPLKLHKLIHSLQGSASQLGAVAVINFLKRLPANSEDLPKNAVEDAAKLCAEQTASAIHKWIATRSVGIA
ncbi:MAG: response regulator [Burkholderiales bacterium]|nr:MAG: response regulator [Burkholderiales bacterium]